VCDPQLFWGRAGCECSGLGLESREAPTTPKLRACRGVACSPQQLRAGSYPPVVMVTRSMRGCPGGSSACSAKASAPSASSSGGSNPRITKLTVASPSLHSPRSRRARTTSVTSKLAVAGCHPCPPPRHRGSPCRSNTLFGQSLTQHGRVDKAGFAGSGGGRIRTSVGDNRQGYDLPPLTARARPPKAQVYTTGGASARPSGVVGNG
jgi:hypothetical protein